MMKAYARVSGARRNLRHDKHINSPFRAYSRIVITIEKCVFEEVYLFLFRKVCYKHQIATYKSARLHFVASKKNRAKLNMAAKRQQAALYENECF